MAAGLLVPWAAVLGLVALGAAGAVPWLSHAADAAMLLGMLAVMLFRRAHYAHGATHQRAAVHAERHPGCTTRAQRAGKDSRRPTCGWPAACNRSVLL
jgi:hypothetical protein